MGQPLAAHLLRVRGRLTAGADDDPVCCLTSGHTVVRTAAPGAGGSFARTVADLPPGRYLLTLFATAREARRYELLLTADLDVDVGAVAPARAEYPPGEYEVVGAVPERPVARFALTVVPERTAYPLGRVALPADTSTGGR